MSWPCAHSNNRGLAYVPVKRPAGLMHVATEVRVLVMIGSSKIADGGSCTGRTCAAVSAAKHIGYMTVQKLDWE